MKLSDTLSDELRGASLRDEVMAAITVTVMSVPQGVAYAMIAGLPPAMGLYAGALPAIFGSLFRSSRHVVSGPTNALSLLIGTSVAATMDDPVAAALTLSLLIGLVQVGAGVLRLGALVDYISAAVVAGYITGAGILIGVGQLPNITATPGVRGNIAERLVHWASTLNDAAPLAAALGLGTTAAIVGLRRFTHGSAASLVAVGGGLALSMALGLESAGLRVIGDLAPVPAGLPPFTIPRLDTVGQLAPVALAGVVLSLVEATSVARSIASKTGQRLDLSREFVGQGLANVAAAFSGAYPVSGSLGRSMLNEQSGAKTRFAGVLSGVAMLLVLLGLGPVVDHIPIASLAGLLLVVAADLVDIRRIRRILSGSIGDKLAFAGTLLGTWTLSLDQAIYVGVAISIVLFLQRARLLMVRELRVDTNLRLREVDPEEPDDSLCACPAIRVLHVEGPLFFGAANELDDALQHAIQDLRMQVLIVRLKRTQGMDFTVGEVLAAADRRLSAEGRTLLLVGMRAPTMEALRRTGVADAIGDEHLYPTRPGWFVAMNAALVHALAIIEQRGHDCSDCAIQRYVQARRVAPKVVGHP